MGRIIKISLCVILCLAALTSLSACKKEKSVSMYDLEQKMIAADTSLPPMSLAISSADNAKDLFSYISNIDYSKVDGFFIAYSSKGKADEIAVIRLKNAEDVPLLKTSVDKHVNKRLNLYKQYDPTQTYRVKKAETFTHGNYCVLIICDNSQRVKEAFLNFVK